MLTRALLLLILVLACPIFGQSPAGGKLVFPEPALDQLILAGAEKKGEIKMVSVEGQPFKEALRLTTFEKGAYDYELQAYAYVPIPVEAGDVMLAEFQARAVETKTESGEAYSEFGFERFGGSWRKAVGFRFSVGRAWKKFSIPFKAIESLAAGNAGIYFRMGYDPQAFELADLKLTNYEKKAKVENLPQTKMSYIGMESDAVWRKAAADRIEKSRKGNLSVIVSDASGKPVKGAKVSVRMKRHARSEKSHCFSQARQGRDLTACCFKIAR